MKYEKIQMCFDLMEYDELTDNELDWIVKLEERWLKWGNLSEKEQEILNDIFKRAAERVGWSR
jgi:hypothetical protein